MQQRVHLTVAVRNQLQCATARSVKALKHWRLQEWEGRDDVVYARSLVKAGEPVTCVADGLPTWVCEVMATKSSLAAAVDFVVQVCTSPCSAALACQLIAHQAALRSCYPAPAPPLQQLQHSACAHAAADAWCRRLRRWSTRRSGSRSPSPTSRTATRRALTVKSAPHTVYPSVALGHQMCPCKQPRQQHSTRHRQRMTAGLN